MTAIADLVDLHLRIESADGDDIDAFSLSYDTTVSHAHHDRSLTGRWCPSSADTYLLPTMS